jgi:hypothetical protein
MGLILIVGRSTNVVVAHTSCVPRLLLLLHRPAPQQQAAPPTHYGAVPPRRLSLLHERAAT